MRQSFIFLLVVFFGFALFALRFTLPAQAQSVAQTVTLTYPVPQLGNCRDAKECYFYCEIPRHQDACADFASSRRLPQVLGTATGTFREKVLQASTKLGITFPVPELGNCGNPDECRSFCQEEGNKSACRAFAQEHDLKVTASTKVTFPIPELGNCESAPACKAYCEDETHRDACRAFAQNHGLKLRKKTQEVIEKAKAELGCTTIDECKNYCQDPEHQASCRAFGLKHRELNQLKRDEKKEQRDINREKLRSPFPAVDREKRPRTFDTLEDRVEKPFENPLEPSVDKEASPTPLP